MSTDWRALCAELISALADFKPLNNRELAALDRARAALAEPVGEPSNENYWQWYTYCPEEGLEMYSDREQAQSAAQSIMGSYEVAAHSDGWHEDMESVSWGMLVPVEQAQVVERKTADPDSEFDEWVKYELRPARSGHQPAPPAAGELSDEDLGEPLGDLIDKWFEEGMRVKPYGTSFPLSRYVASRAYQYGLSKGHQPAPPAAVAPGPSMEDVGPLIAWLTEQAHQAADASQPTDAGMLTWAAQVIGERVDEDAPAPSAAGEVGELVRRLRCAKQNGNNIPSKVHWGLADGTTHYATIYVGDDHADDCARAADLLSQRHPAPVPVAERLPGPEDCDGEGRVWVSYKPPESQATIFWELMTMDQAMEWAPVDSWLPATALPLPAGEVQP